MNCHTYSWQQDWLILLPLALCLFNMLRWAYAYFIFPSAMKAVLKGVNVGPFKDHLVGFARFVLWCGVSHLIMFLKDLVMLGLMVGVVFTQYKIPEIVFWGILPFLFFGSEYSIYRARRLQEDSAEINKFIHVAGQLSRG